jgi:hypothetical protein
MKTFLKRLRCVLVFVPVLAALAAPATTSADTIFKDVTVQRDFAISEPSCVPDEFLVLTGTVRDRLVIRMDSSGGWHFDDYSSTHGSGSGFSVSDVLMQTPIASYFANDDALTTINIPGPTFETDTVSYTRVIRQAETVDPVTGGDDLYLRTHTHFTLNANGVPTASVDQPSAVCR